jgi:hypothetical protein
MEKGIGTNLTPLEPISSGERVETPFFPKRPVKMSA